MQDTNVSQQPLNVNENLQTHDGMTPEEKRVESYKVRLSKARQEAEEEAKRAEKLEKQIADLKKKFESGKATTDESANYVNASNTIDNAEAGKIHPDDLPGIIEDQIQTRSFREKMKVALEKDPELLRLYNDPNSAQKISGEEFQALKHLDNAPAVFKHLLTNDEDRQILKDAEVAAMNGDQGRMFFTFLGNLSARLAAKESLPHPSKFKEPINLSDVGEGEEFDSATYISKKYR